MAIIVPLQDLREVLGKGSADLPQNADEGVGNRRPVRGGGIKSGRSGLVDEEAARRRGDEEGLVFQSGHFEVEQIPCGHESSR